VKKVNLRIALAQINCIVGDLEGNLKKIKGYIQKAEESGADIVAFPELAITGYPPEDLLLKPKFVKDNLGSMKELVKFVDNIAVIVGFVDRKDSKLYNAAAVIYSGDIKGVYHKIFLPNYDVFDEKRYFKAGNEPLVFRFADTVFAVSICEDIWHKEGPTRLQALSGAQLIFNISASVYHIGKAEEREAVIRAQAKANHIQLAYVNLIGGQDELVFDGRSIIADTHGALIARAGAFTEDLLIQDLVIPGSRIKASKKMITVTGSIPYKNKVWLSQEKIKPLSHIVEVRQALALGLKDYVAKNGFQKVVLGLSGGIDSSLVAALAATTLGKENVIGVFMPSRHSSPESETDAKELAKNLGIKIITISIEQIYTMYLLILDAQFAGLERNTAEENLQARIRGNILMALSNKFGWLVLATGNKSEMSTGYATLYGDMAGGFAVIKDVPKILVYKLARHINYLSAAIPERVFTKAPTAELKVGQKDSDTLPPYENLDRILKAYVEEDKDLNEIISLGFDQEIISSVLGW